MRDANAIKRLFFNPCVPAPLVMVEMAVPAILNAVWQTLLNPDPKELYHKIRGNSVYHDIKAGIVDAGILPDAESSAATRFLFQSADLADISAWSLFLFGAASRGLMSYQSQIMHMTACANPGDPDAGSGSGYVSAIADNGNPSGVDLFFTYGDGFQNPGPLDTSANHHRSCYVSANIAFEDFGGQAVGANGFTFQNGTNRVVDQHTNGPGDSTPTRGVKMWQRQPQNADGDSSISMQFSYTGLPLPLHEAFENEEASSGSIFPRA